MRFINVSHEDVLLARSVISETKNSHRGWVVKHFQTPKRSFSRKSWLSWSHVTVSNVCPISVSFDDGWLSIKCCYIVWQRIGILEEASMQILIFFIADNICYSLGSKEIPEHRQAMGKDYDSRAWERKCCTMLCWRRNSWTAAASFAGATWTLPKVT